MIYIAILARYVFAEGIGKITVAQSVCTLAFVFVNLGFGTLITRDVAIDHTRSALYLASVNSIKLIFGIAAIIIIFIFSKTYSPETQSIIMMYAVLSLLGALYNTFSAVCQGHERMEYDMALQLGRDIMNISLSLLAIYFKASLDVIVGVSLLATAVQLLFVGPTLRLLKVPLFVWPGIPELRRFFIMGLPFSALVLISVAGQNLTMIILSIIVSQQQLGLYGAAFNLYVTLVIIPSTFSTALLPVYSRLSADSSNKIKYVFQKSFEILLIIGFPLVTLSILMAKQMVQLLYGASFIGAVPVFQLLALSLVSITGFACGNYLIVTGRQTFFAISQSVFVTIQIILAIILIPHFGINGAAICMVVTSFLGLVYYTLVSYYFSNLPLPWLLFTKVLFITTIITIGAQFILRLGMYFIPVGIIAVLFYSILVLVFRLIPYKEVLIIWGTLSNRFKMHNSLDIGE
jgi:O-antigen/teichoic acid export membrane protein